MFYQGTKFMELTVGLVLLFIGSILSLVFFADDYQNTSELASSGPRLSCEERYNNFESPNNICKEWGDNSNAIIQRCDDGSVLLNPIQMEQKFLPPEIEQRMTDPNRDPVLTQKMDRMIESLKESMRLQVIGGTPLSELNQHQRYILSRLETLRVERDEECPDFNATYVQQYNVLQICNFNTHMPAEASLALIAHELGHLADVCNYADTFRFTDRIDERASFQSRVSECLRGEPPSAVAELANWMMDKNRWTNRQIAVYAFDPDKRRLAERLASCELLTTPSIRAPLTYGGHPYYETLACVSENYPRGTDRFTEQNENRDYVEIRNVYRSPRPISPTTTIQSPDSAPQCANDRSAMRSPVKETTADYVGAALLNFHLERVGDTIPQNRRHLLTFWHAFVNCASRGRTDNGAEYVSSTERMRFLLDVPKVRNFVGCEGSAGVPVSCPLDGRVSDVGASSSRRNGSPNRAD